MKTKSRILPTSIVDCHQYSTYVASQTLRLLDENPQWPFVDVPTNTSAPNGERDYTGRFAWKRLIKGAIYPTKLRGYEDMVYSTSLKQRSLHGLLDWTIYLKCHHNRVKYTPMESYYYGGWYWWRWYGKELRDQNSYTRLLWYPGLYGNTVTTKETRTVTETEFRRAANSSLLNLLAGKPQRPMNVALAVIELKDLGTTVKQLCHFTRWCVKAIKGPAIETGAPGFIRLMSSIRAQGFKANMRHLAEAYLWESFGVQPTVTDVQNFIKDVGNGRLHVKGAKPSDRLVPGHTAKSWFKVRPYDRDGTGKPLGFPNLSYYERIESTTQKSWQINTRRNCQYNWRVITDEYRGCVFARLNPERFELFKRYFPTDFNWGNPLFRTAWELIPFSFVVDWFIDVGAAIQRLDDLSYVAWTRLAWEEPWISYAKITTEWYPCLDFLGHASYKDLKPRTGTSGWQDAQYNYVVTYMQSGYWYAGKRTISYHRMPAHEAGVSYYELLKGLIPRQKVTFKRYQLTTGMALVVSMSKLFK